MMSHQDQVSVTCIRQEELRPISVRLYARVRTEVSVVTNFIRARLGIAILRATHHCIRSPRIPASKMSRHIDWTGPAGLALF
eukprot:scaffold120_cov59-Cylindrotheca_fusiformis.AAC.2